MYIKKKHVRSLRGRVGGLKAGAPVVVGIKLTGDLKPSLEKIGFPPDSAIGDSILPAMIGAKTRFNAEGGYIVHKDLPMETAYREINWSWMEWHGREQVEQSDFRFVPYERYQRTRVPAPGIELKMAVDTAGQRVLVAPPHEYSGPDDASLIHKVNLFLEVFGYCYIFTHDLKELIQAPLRRLNWNVLPPGKRLWSELRPLVRKVVQRAKDGSQPVIEHHLEEINQFGPDFVAIGNAGFAGYVVFGFSDRNIFVFESIYSGNATYAFGDKWEALSKLTKTQIIDGSLHKARIVHVAGWEDQIHRLLRPSPPLSR